MTDLSSLIERIEKLEKRAEGSGHSIHFGGQCVRRYDPETGRPYYRDDPGTLSTSSAKMRAIWEWWELLPEIAATLRAVSTTEPGDGG